MRRSRKPLVAQAAREFESLPLRASASARCGCVRRRRWPWGGALACRWRWTQTTLVLQLRRQGAERRRELSSDPALPAEVKYQRVEQAGRLDRRAQADDTARRGGGDRPAHGHGG